MQEMNWISVKDKLPGPLEDVLVCYTCGKVTCGYKHYSGDWSLEGLYGPVTHWMPLPEPPKEVCNHDQG